VTETLEVREPRAETASRWAERARTEARLCACGCRAQVEVKARHRAKSKGVPRYVPGHHPNLLRQMYLHVKEAELLTTGQVCRRLGISASTYHRLEAVGIFAAPARWGKWPRPEMRVFRASDVATMRARMRAARRPGPSGA
jgi:hypothetical protein